VNIAPASRRARLRPVAALATVLAAAVSFCLEYALCAYAGSGPQPAILAAILALGMARRAGRRRGTDALLAALNVAVVALAVAVVAFVFHFNRYLGAVVFTGGLFLSVWLRNFDGRLRALGALIALPLVAILIVPGPGPGDQTNLIVRIGLVACAGLLAYGCNALAGRFIGREPESAPPAATGAEPRPKRPGPSIATRMAAQMGVAVALAFSAGFVLFPGHWGWTVLTAFIVCSGVLGRGDAVYKAVLRFIGAIAGTALAAVASAIWLPSGPLEAVAIFVILFAGLLLRDRNYAYWAACTTLILALLARTGDAPALALLACGSKRSSRVPSAPSPQPGSCFRFEPRTSCGGALPTRSKRSTIWSCTRTTATMNTRAGAPRSRRRSKTSTVSRRPSSGTTGSCAGRPRPIIPRSGSTTHVACARRASTTRSNAARFGARSDGRAKRSAITANPTQRSRSAPPSPRSMRRCPAHRDV